MMIRNVHSPVKSVLIIFTVLPVCLDTRKFGLPFVKEHIGCISETGDQRLHFRSLDKKSLARIGFVVVCQDGSYSRR